MPQEPAPAARTSPHDDFLPEYEHAVNQNMRDFDRLESQASMQPFDGIQEPQRRSLWSYLSWRQRVLLFIFSAICLVVVSGVLIWTSRHAEEKSRTADVRSTPALGCS